MQNKHFATRHTHMQTHSWKCKRLPFADIERDTQTVRGGGQYNINQSKRKQKFAHTSPRSTARMRSRKRRSKAQGDDVDGEEEVVA